MVKEKKTTFKFTIKANLKGITLENGNVKHSLYLLVVYNNKKSLFTVATLLPELDNKDKAKSMFYVTESELPLIIKSDLGRKIYETLDIIIKFEKEIFKEDFSVQGLGKRVKVYKKSAFEQLVEILNDKTFEKRLGSDFFKFYEFFQTEFKNKPELRKTTVLDWLFDVTFSDKYSISDIVHNYLYNGDEKQEQQFKEFCLMFLSLFDEDILLFYENDIEKVRKAVEKRFSKV